MGMEWSAGHWTDLVRRICAGDSSGVEQLYSNLRTIVRGKSLANLLRMAGDYHFEDGLHEVLIVVLQAIRTGQVRDAEKLPGFIHTVARRRIVADLRRAAASRRLAAAGAAFSPDSPEARLDFLEKTRQLHAALAWLSRRDREILERFYFKGQPAKQICEEMNLTGTQFRLYKSRAIAKCSNFIGAGETAWTFSRPIPPGLRIA